MALALYYGDAIAIHVFQQDLEVAKVGSAVPLKHHIPPRSI